ncbi:MAG: hypothetical protein KDA28_11680, partial [Phycisphaerales bacterium]|nr:hypothetical protein [Phycisphaerales bacterium]
VIDLDTPGGELGAFLEICEAIKQTSIPLRIAWIHPNAYSAGTIIALACQDMVHSRASSMGDALIIAMIFGQLQEMPEHERQKILSPVISEVVDSARLHGYDEFLVQAFVSRGVELWFVEEIDTGARYCINRSEYRAIFGEEPDPNTPVRFPSAPSTEAPLASTSDDVSSSDGFLPASPSVAQVEVDGTTLPTSTRPVFDERQRGRWRLIEKATDGNGPLVVKGDDMIRYGFSERQVNSLEELQAFLGAREVSVLDRTWSESLVRFMTAFPVRLVLIIVFLLALFLSMTTPGLFAPEIVAIVALFGLLGPPFMIGMAAWWEIAAIFGGIGFIAVEIFVIPGFTLFGVVGIVSLIVGLVGTFIAPGPLFGTGGAARVIWPTTMVLAAFFTACVGMYIISKYFQTMPLLSRLVLKTPVPDDEGTLIAAFQPVSDEPQIGMVGVTTSDLRPSGFAEFEGDIIDVQSSLGYIERGRPVRIVGTSMGVAMVEEVTGADLEDHA